MAHQNNAAAACNLLAKALEPYRGRVADKIIDDLVRKLTLIGGPNQETAPSCFRKVKPSTACKGLKTIASLSTARDGCPGERH